MALTRMGYVCTGVWVPEFILVRPEVLRGVHHMFVHAGTDVSEAFQVCGHFRFNHIVIILSLSRAVLHPPQEDAADRP